MGLSFSNIHVRMERSLDEALAGRIAEILMLSLIHISEPTRH